MMYSHRLAEDHKDLKSCSLEKNDYSQFKKAANNLPFEYQGFMRGSIKEWRGLCHVMKERNL